MRIAKALGLGLALLFASRLGAIEVGIEARSGNLHFPWAQEAPTAGSGPYPATNLFWGGSGWVSLGLGEDYALRLAYETDPVLRNILSGVFQFERGIARIGVGPFLGFLNGDGKILSAGLSTSIRLQWPGIAFVSATSDGGLSLGIVADAASVPQTRAELSAGFYTKNAIVSGLISGKRFTETDAAGKLVTDNLILYALTVDIYKKNVPYQVATMAGYQVRSKYFQASDLTDALGSVVLGLELGIQVAPGVKVEGKLSTGAFTFGLEELTGRSPQASSFMFDASLGVRLDLEALPRKPKLSRAAEAPADAPPVPAADPAVPAAPPAAAALPGPEPSPGP